MLENNIGDLLRALHATNAQSDEQCQRVAVLLGFNWIPHAAVSSGKAVTRPSQVEKQGPEKESTPPIVIDEISESWLFPVREAPTKTLPQWYVEADPLPTTTEDVFEEAIPATPLIPKRWTRSHLHDALSCRQARRAIDVDEVIRRIARRAPFQAMPLKPVSAMGQGAQLLIDVHPSMWPFAVDQENVIAEVRRLLNSDQYQVLLADGSPERLVDLDDGEELVYSTPPRSWTIMLLTDFGSGAGTLGWSSSRQQGWFTFLEDLRADNRNVVALVPGRADRMPDFLRGRVEAIAWDRHTSVAHATHDDLTIRGDVPRTAAERKLRSAFRFSPQSVELARYLSLAGRIPRSIVREARLEFCPEGDAGLEAELALGPLVQTRTTDSLLLYPEVAKSLQQELVRRGDLDRAWGFLESFRDKRQPLARLQDKLTWLALRGDDESLLEAHRVMASVIKSVAEENRSGLGQWASAAFARIPIPPNDHRRRVLLEVCQKRSFDESAVVSSGAQRIPDDASTILARRIDTTEIGLLLKGRRLRISEQPPEPAAELITIPAAGRRELTIGDQVVTWEEGDTPPSVNIRKSKQRVEIKTSDGGMHELTPWLEIVGESDDLRNGFGTIVTKAGFVAGPACIVDGRSILTTRRVLAAARQKAAKSKTGAVEMFFSQRPAGVIERVTRSAKTYAIAAAPVEDSAPEELERTDEPLLLEIDESLPSSEWSQQAPVPGDNCFALGCTRRGLPSWTRFKVQEAEEGQFRLEPVANLRWLELQNWTGALLLDSQTRERTGIALATPSGLMVDRSFVKASTKESQLSAEERPRIQRPRLHLTYESETTGATNVVELPFVVGVIADCLGHSRPVPSLADRKFVPMDRDGFEDAMQQLGPSLEFKLADPNLRLADLEQSRQEDGEPLASYVMTFHSMDDFHPERLALAIPGTRHLVEKRASLRDLLRQHDASPDLKKSMNALLRKDKSSLVAGDAMLRNAVVESFESPANQDETNRLLDLLLELRESASDLTSDERSAAKLIRRAVDRLDEELSSQIAAILHHPEFQQLEGTWRGIHYLVMNTDTSATLKIQLLPASKEELSRDFKRAGEFDNSQLWRRIYRGQIEVPGGEPFGALILDSYFDHSPSDVALLSQLSRVGANAFCPLITGCSPRLIGADTWSDLHRPRDLKKTVEVDTHIAWRSFRESEESRFVVMTMPRTLARTPYGVNTNPTDNSVFNFEELALSADGKSTPGRDDAYCWMNTAFVMGTRLTESFARHGMCTAITGAVGGGKVENLPLHIFFAEDGSQDMQCPTEIAITDRREKEFADLGLLPLTHYKNTDYAVFFDAQTVQNPRQYDRPSATENARLRSRLPYVMASSRFAHYIQIIGRDGIGSFREREDLQSWLNHWIVEYVDADPNPSATTAFIYPLWEAQVEVREVPGRPGAYDAIVDLRPKLIAENPTETSQMVVRIPSPY